MLHSLKALNDEGRIGGYLVVFGDASRRDLQGEYFTQSTELGLDWYDQRPVLYHHGLDGTLKAAVIGVIDHLKTDATGLWAEAQLSLRQRYVKRVLQLVEKGILCWSSGSLPHLVEVAADGHIKRWPIVEGSLTPTPAEPRSTDVNPIKADYCFSDRAIVSQTYQSLGWDTVRLSLDAELPALQWTIKTATAPTMTLEELLAAKAADMDDEADTDGIAASDDAMPPSDSPTTTDNPDEVKTMDPQVLRNFAVALAQLTGWNGTDEELNALIAQAQSAIEAAPEMAAQATEMAAGKSTELGNLLKPVFQPLFAPAIEKQRKAREFADAAAKSVVEGSVGAGGRSVVGGFRSPEAASQQYGNGGNTMRRIETATKFQDMDARDMSFYAMVQRFHARKNGTIWTQPEFFMEELCDKAAKSVTQGKLTLDADMAVAIKSVNTQAVKANELNTSTQAGFGDEWVPDLWASDLWRRARVETNVLGLFRAIDMPSQPFELPIEAADPTLYFVPETADETHLTLAGSGNPIPDSKVGTGKVMLDAKKLGLRVGLSEETVEDSIIPLIQIAREQAEKSIFEGIDMVLLNGDPTTAGTGNVNSDDAAPPSSSKYLAFKGLIRYAFDSGAALRVDAINAAPTLALIRSTRFGLASRYAARQKDIAWITGGEVYGKLLNLPEYITMEKAGALATAMTGQLGFLDGSPLIYTDQLALAEADGKVNTAVPSATLKGRLIGVYRPNFYVGYRRRVKIDVTYLPYFDSYQLTATVRLAFINFDLFSTSLLFNLAA